MTNARSRMGMRLAGAGLLFALVACGDETPTAVPTPAPPTPSSGLPTPPPPSLVLQGEEPLTAPTGRRGTRVLKWDISLPVSGTLDVTITYLHDDSGIGVWVTDRRCNVWQFGRDECFYLTKSVEGATPRTLQASGVRPGTYTLFVANDGPHDETIGYRVTLLPSSNNDGRLVEGSATGPPAP